MLCLCSNLFHRVSPMQVLSELEFCVPSVPRLDLKDSFVVKFFLLLPLFAARSSCRVGDGAPSPHPVVGTRSSGDHARVQSNGLSLPRAKARGWAGSQLQHLEHHRRHLGSDRFARTIFCPSHPEPVLEILFNDVTPPIREALRRLDGCDVEQIFARRGCVMKSVPFFLKGPFRSALRIALIEATADEHVLRSRGGKLFLLLPRMLFSRRPRGGSVSQEKLRKRFELFTAGQWKELIWPTKHVL